MQYEHLQAQLSHAHNFRAPLELLQTCSPPCVPFLGIFLTQIVAVEEGSPDTLPAQGHGGGGLINFAKRKKLGEIIGKLQTYQDGAYAFAPHAQVEAYVSPRVHSWQAALLDGALKGDVSYKSAIESLLDKASLRCEPRRRATAPPTAPPESGGGATALRRGRSEEDLLRVANGAASGSNATTPRRSVVSTVVGVPTLMRRGSAHI